MKANAIPIPKSDLYAGVVKILCALTLLFSYADLYAAEDVSENVNDILKLRLSPEEKIDSAFKYIMNSPGLVKDSAYYALCEMTIRENIVPYAVTKQYDDRLLARIYDELGMMNNRIGPSRISQTRDAYKKGLEYAGAAADHYRVGRILEHLANTETRFGNVADGFRLSEEAIRAYLKCGEEAEEWITRCYYTQAVAYLNVSDLAGMRKTIEKLEDFSRKASDANRPFVLYNLYSVQEAYYGTLLQTDPKIDRKAMADTLNRISLASVRLIDENYDYWKHTSINPVWNYYNRAVFFLEEIHPVIVDSVDYYLEKALSVDFSGKGSGRAEILVSVASLRAEMWMKLGDYSKAKEILLETVASLDKLDGVNNLVLDKIEIYKNLLDISKQAGRYQEALDFASMLSTFEKERFSEERAKAVKDIEIKYETREKELALVQSESRRKSTLMWLFAALGLMLIGIIAFVIHAGRERRRRLMKEVEFTKLRDDIGRQLTQQYVEGLESERKRMARELHDGVCNDLLAIQMGMAEGKTNDDTVKLLDECREAVRRISHELMPPEFAYASLDEVVRFFVYKQADSNAGKIAITYSSSVHGGSWADVPDSVALEIYRIVQEAVGNAIKHSGCDMIEVSMTLDGDTLNLKVSDNGFFRYTRDKGFGLQSIRKRAEAIGADIRIDLQESEDAAESKQGTTLSLKLKLKEI